jgi:CheY-like chemotaxis protein
MADQSAHTIVIVDDNPGDIDLLILAFEARHVPVQFTVLGSGPEAFYLMRTLVKNSPAPLPSLLLLDLNMPAFNGFQLLGYIRTQPILAQLKVIMFSATDRQRDRDRAMELGASAYLTKPHDWDGYAAPVQSLCQAIGLDSGSHPVLGSSSASAAQGGQHDEP